MAFKVNINNKKITVKKIKVNYSHATACEHTRFKIRFKLDINVNFTRQNSDLVLISAFLLLSPILTPKYVSLFICYNITLTD